VASTGRENPDLHRQSRGNIDDGLVPGHQNLGDATSESLRAFDRIQRILEGGSPFQQGGAGSFVDRDAACSQHRALVIDSDGCQG
jgi:hypothetical protein